jgi:type 1 fimbriae regulatory protein FimB
MTGMNILMATGRGGSVMNHLPVDGREKNFLTESEMRQMLESSRRGRHGVRDHLMVLLAYRHGLRVSELIDVRLSDLDLEAKIIYIRRCKGSLSTNQPLQADETEAIYAWLPIRGGTDSPYLFLGERGPLTRQAVNYLFSEIGKRAGIPVHVHPHMIRHSTGYALANKGFDTRLIQDYLGHRNITHTVKYTRISAARFENLWH